MLPAFAAALSFPNFDPVAVTIPLLDFPIRWYALAYIVGILIGWRIALAAVKTTRLWAKDSPPMTPQQVEDLMTWIIIGVLLGGRLGFVIFYRPFYYLQNLAEIPAVWQGGMAFHGGFLGVLLAIYLYCKRHKLALLSVGDAIAISVPPALLLGRLSNFINAELWGRPSDVPWAVVFPGQAAQDCPGVLGACARHPSQLYEAGLEGLLLGLVLIVLVWRFDILKRPGAAVGVFFAGYGAARVFVEFFRQPDAQFVTPGNPLGYILHVNGIGITQGQLLSLPMIAIGLWLLFRKDPAKHHAS